jgi:polar amino acid transport system substrate-binding protein
MVRIGHEAKPRGISHDIGTALAARLNVPVEVVEFRTGNELLAATKAGTVDLMGTNATAVRAMDVDFTVTVVEIELGYLVPAGSVLQTADDMKRAGLRVGITQNSTSQTTVPQRLPQAVVVLAPTLADASRLIKEGGVDVYTTNKAILFQLSDDLPGLPRSARQRRRRAVGDGGSQGPTGGAAVLELVPARSAAER